MSTDASTGFTHAYLVERASAWLRTVVRCPMVFSEIVSIQAETPDAIGWRNSASESFLVECKVSRTDFLADRRKPFRRCPEQGMGLYRYYLCPPGIIRVDDLPPGWGLLYCHPQIIQVVHGRHPRRYDADARQAFTHAQRHVAGELRMLYSALSRLKIDMGERQFNSRVHLTYHDRKRERDAKAEVPDAARGPLSPASTLQFEELT